MNPRIEIVEAIHYCDQAKTCLEKEQFQEAKDHLKRARQIILKALPIDQTNTTPPSKDSSVFLAAVHQRKARLNNLLDRIQRLESQVDRLQKESEEYHTQSYPVI